MKIVRMNTENFHNFVNDEDLMEEKVFGSELDDDQDQVIYHYHDRYTRKLVAVYHDMGPIGEADCFKLVH